MLAEILTWIVAFTFVAIVWKMDPIAHRAKSWWPAKNPFWRVIMLAAVIILLAVRAWFVWYG